MAQTPQGVVEISSPKDHLICVRVPLSNRLHAARFGKTVIPIRKSRILVPETASPLLRNICSGIEDFVDDIAGDIPVNYQLLRIELSVITRRLDVLKSCRAACRATGLRDTIRDRRSILLMT